MVFHSLNQQPEPLLVFPHPLFCCLSFGDVKDGEKRHFLSAGVGDDVAAVAENSPPFLVKTADTQFVVAQWFAPEKPSHWPLLKLHHSTVKCRKFQIINELRQ